MVSISDVTKEFENTMMVRRTIGGVAKKLRAKKNEIRSVLDANTDLFRKVRGCKGEMYEQIL